MDENSGNTTDKRNWRERLGIGKGAANPDMPKIADDFKAAGSVPQPADPRAPVAAAAASTPKPGTARPAAPLAPRPTGAPMAPRPAARPVSSVPPGVPAGSAKPAAPRIPPVASDALANKLRDQREAAEKLAIQRIQAAKQRAEAASQPGATLGAKPKFSFADDDRSGASSPSVLPSLPPRIPAQPAGSPQRGAAPPVQTETARPAPVNPMAPPPAMPSFSPQQPPTFQPQMPPPRPQLGTPPSFAGPAGFPRQAQTGYPPPPQSPFQPPYQAPYPGDGFSPQPPAYRPVDPQGGFPVQPGRSGYVVPPVPPRGPAPPRPTFQQGGQPGPKLSAPGRGPQVAIGPALSSDAEADDVFEPTPVRAPRRATANEYQQAYRDEMSYDDEAPRSRGLGMILGLVLLGLLVAFGVVFGYSRLVKTSHVATPGSGVPVVAAPQSTPKALPDAATAGQAADTGKKQIYDRIEGDHEIPGGALKTNEESPQPPQAPAGTAPGAGTDGTPLPLPPPPGNGTGQQGALTSDPKTDIASNTQAAGQSSAANSSVVPLSNQQISPTSGTVEQNANANTSNGSTSASNATNTNTAGTAASAGLPAPALDTPAAKNSESVVSGTPAPKPAKPADPMKKLVLGNKAAKSLGSKPVVLVPPAKTAPPIQTASSEPAPGVVQSTPSVSGGNGLYGDAPATTPIAPPPPLKSSNPVVATAPAKPSLALPATGAYVAQLASFNSKAEASAEYQRLAAKHGAIITRYAPLIETAQVAGATRYRLNLGPMASNDAAASVCSSLISAGERDCLVRRQ